MTLKEKLKVLEDFCDERPCGKTCPVYNSNGYCGGTELTEEEVNKNYKIVVDFINSTNSVISTDSINYTKENYTSSKMKLCGITKHPCINGCTPCCDYCIHVLHHFFKCNGADVRDEPIGCCLHRDYEHQTIAENCGDCEDFCCVNIQNNETNK